MDRPLGHRGLHRRRQELEAGPGDIVVVDPETPHKFVNAGPGKLDIGCIHASPVMVQEDLE